MIKEMKKLGVCILMIFTGLQAFGQQQDSLTVVLQANPGKESIRLRWAVTRPYQWDKSLKMGYVIERYTVKRDGVLLPEREKKVLTPVPLTPAPLDQWEHVAKNNDYGAVLAQALYGETFEVTGMESNSLMDVVNLSEELEQRYAFALSAADMCFECACLAGWGYEDREAVKGEYYLYRVIPVGDGIEAWQVEPGFAYTGLDDYRELPKPVYLQAAFGDRMVQLQWDSQLFNRIFSAWQVEKSDDNHNFKSVGMPVTSWDAGSTNVVMADSLDVNGKTYYYRVRGISIFGNRSEPSDVVSGQGVESLKIAPVITRSTINDEGFVEIEWTFDETSDHLVQSFDLMHSATSKGEFRPVLESIPAKDRFLLYDGALLPSNYFSIAVNPVHGEKVQSFPVLIMPVDSVPPAAPQQLSAKADTLGRMYLTWAPNTEPDLQGYKLYRGHVAGEELIPLPIDVLTSAQYVDTVDLSNLNTHVYYAVKALDMRYNQSAFSETLAVEKPLKVKPSPPVFNKYEAKDDGIYIQWINSPGREVAEHILYRSLSDSLIYTPLSVFESDTVTSYTDSAVEGGRSYTYRITAKSRWGVESDPSPDLQVSAVPGTKPVALKQFRAVADVAGKIIKLTWKPVNNQEVKSWKLYRSENDMPLSLWKNLESGSDAVEDHSSLIAGNTYHYMIYAVMRDGSNSLHEKISIVY